VKFGNLRKNTKFWVIYFRTQPWAAAQCGPLRKARWILDFVGCFHIRK
jgi:hypothetical protein